MEENMDYHEEKETYQCYNKRTLKPIGVTKRTTKSGCKAD